MKYTLLQKFSLDEPTGSIIQIDYSCGTADRVLVIDLKGAYAPTTPKQSVQMGKCLENFLTINRRTKRLLNPLS